MVTKGQRRQLVPLFFNHPYGRHSSVTRIFKAYLHLRELLPQWHQAGLLLRLLTTLGHRNRVQTIEYRKGLSRLHLLGHNGLKQTKLFAGSAEAVPLLAATTRRAMRTGLLEFHQSAMAMSTPRLKLTCQSSIQHWTKASERAILNSNIESVRESALHSSTKCLNIS